MKISMSRFFLASLVVLGLSGCGGSSGGGGATTVAPPATLTGISSISITSTSIAKGQSANLIATGTYAGGTTADISSLVTWASGNTNIATIISTTGVATGVAVGSTTITATGNGITSNSAALTVTAPVLATIAMTPSTSATIIVGNTQQFSASGTLTDGATAVLGTLTWSSSDPLVASVNSSGLATGVKAGTTNISTSNGDITSNATILTVSSTVGVVGTQIGGARQGVNLSLTGTDSIFAGSSTVGLINGSATSAAFNAPTDVTTDGINLYVADSGNNVIRKIVISTGDVTTIAGSGVAGFLDGVGNLAKFNHPGRITTDGTNLYVTDGGNYRIRKVVISTGAVTTLAGSGSQAYTNNVNGLLAAFYAPFGITIAGNALYVVDGGANAIRKVIISTGEVSTFAGSLTGISGSLDGTGTTATFDGPNGITTDGTNLYVTQWINGPKIRKIAIANASVTTLAGSSTAGTADGTGTLATFTNSIRGITTDGTTLYVADYTQGAIRKIVINTGGVTTLQLSTSPPYGVTTDGVKLFITDYSSCDIAKVE